MRLDNGVLEPPPRLTQRQIDVMRFIWEYFRRTEVYPTHREIASGIGARSTNVAPWLHALVRKGVLSKKSDGSRNIRITTLGIVALQRAGVIPEAEQLEF